MNLLDLLDRNSTCATFFVVGNAAKQRPDVMLEIVRRGHSIGNHSLKHQAFAKQPLSAQIEEIETTDAIIFDTSGTRSIGFRPPQGRCTPQLLWWLIRNGIRLVHWNYDSLDYKRDMDLTQNLFNERRPKRGDVLLFHDDCEFAGQFLAENLSRWIAGTDFAAIA